MTWTNQRARGRLDSHLRAWLGCDWRRALVRYIPAAVQMWEEQQGLLCATEQVCISLPWNLEEITSSSSYPPFWRAWMRIKIILDKLSWCSLVLPSTKWIVSCSISYVLCNLVSKSADYWCLLWSCVEIKWAVMPKYKEDILRLSAHIYINFSCLRKVTLNICFQV